MVGNSRPSTSERIVWDNDLVGTLNAEVHLNEVVWDISSPLCKNKNMWGAALEDISFTKEAEFYTSLPKHKTK